MTETVRVDLAERGYDILIGPALLAEAGAVIAARLPVRRVIVITDETVAGRHLATLTRGLTEGGIGLHGDAVVLPPGERTKAIEPLATLLDTLLDRGVERGTLLLALGGGVIGDLAGFAAAVLLRGIGFIQVPTTLLAQVDSSVGGKTGINTRHGKNLIGAFHQPRLVLADTGVLDTLPRRDLLAGYAEVVKYGLIGDAAFFAWCEAHGRALIDGDPAARAYAVAVSCRAKAAIVGADEREAGSRALLNFGHTFGHALEAESGYGADLLHGEAVAIGMIMAMDLSVRLGLCPAADRDRAAAHLAAIGLPVRYKPTDPDALIAHMTRDKKVRDGTVTFVLSRGIGQAHTAAGIPEALVRDVLRHAAS
jgi:3-dehydroquinate synthase